MEYRLLASEHRPASLSRRLDSCHRHSWERRIPSPSPSLQGSFHLLPRFFIVRTDACSTDSIPPPPGYPGNLAFPPPPGAPNPFPVLPIGLPFPPPGMVAFPPAPAGFVPPSFPSAPLPFPPPPAVNLAVAPGTPSGPAAMRAQAQAVVEKVESSSVVLKEGTLLVYGDADVSPVRPPSSLVSPFKY